MSEATPETTAVDHSVGRAETLLLTWNNHSAPFDAWVREVSAAYFSSRLRLEGASKLLDTTPAELQAVLRLATLEDEDLATLAESPPPKTTWLSFATAESEGIRAGVAALRTLGPGDSPFRAVERAIRDAEGPTPLERVAELHPRTITHMAAKAKQYNLLSGKARQALVSFGIIRRSGRELSQKQVAYLFNLLSDLVEGGAVKRDSPDGDQPACDAVLDALGVDE